MKPIYNEIHITCGVCGAKLSYMEKFCGNCGTSIDLIRCPGCSYPLAPPTRFCPGCGTLVDQKVFEKGGTNGVT